MALADMSEDAAVGHGRVGGVGIGIELPQEHAVRPDGGVSLRVCTLALQLGLTKRLI